MRGYRDDLDSMIKPMRAEFEQEIERVLRVEKYGTLDAPLVSRLLTLFDELDEKWSKRFAKASRKLADRIAERIDVASRTNLNSSLREASGELTLSVPKMPAGLGDKMAAAAAENVALIKSIPSKYAEQIRSSVLSSVQTGGKGSAQILKEVKHLGHSTEKRAELIARDQTRKITSAMNGERAQAVGVEEFEWVHSGGGNDPRPEHVAMNGKIYRYDDPPVIDSKTGERGLPGQLINCGCTARPIIRFKTE